MNIFNNNTLTYFVKYVYNCRTCKYALHLLPLFYLYTNLAITYTISKITLG